MAELGIIAAIQKQEEIAPTQGGTLSIPDGFLTPSFIATATCLGHRRCVSSLTYAAPEKHQGLFEAMRVPFVLTGVDSYQHGRVNQGYRYSPAQMLENADDVDRATTETTSCIRQQVDNVPGISKLCSVIGELHDNVRAHASGTGFSISLHWKQYGKEPVIEFAVADSGQGFLQECRRRGIPDIADDEAAIRWCLTPKNTTKDAVHDEFAQLQPEDAIGNPFGEQSETRPWHNGNHHQGLGLAQLMELIEAYDGTLWIATGTSALVSSPQARQQNPFGLFVEVPNWQGTAIACRLNISELDKIIEEEPFREDIQDILQEILS